MLQANLSFPLGTMPFSVPLVAMLQLIAFVSQLALWMPSVVYR